MSVHRETAGTKRQELVRMAISKHDQPRIKPLLQEPDTQSTDVKDIPVRFSSLQTLFFYFNENPLVQKNVDLILEKLYNAHV